MGFALAPACARVCTDLDSPYKPVWPEMAGDAAAEIRAELDRHYRLPTDKGKPGSKRNTKKYPALEKQGGK